MGSTRYGKLLFKEGQGGKEGYTFISISGARKICRGINAALFPRTMTTPHPPTYTSILEFTGQASLLTFESESDVQKVVMYGHQDHVLYQEKSKDPPLPRAASTL